MCYSSDSDLEIFLNRPLRKALKKLVKKSEFDDMEDFVVHELTCAVVKSDPIYERLLAHIGQGIANTPTMTIVTVRSFFDRGHWKSLPKSTRKILTAYIDGEASNGRLAHLMPTNAYIKGRRQFYVTRPAHAA